MKIAVNTRLLVPEKMDGIARFTYETLQRITKENPSVNFTFIFDRKVNRRQFKFPKNVEFVSLFPPARHPLLWIIWFELRLKNYINNRPFDLFLSPEGWIPPNLKCKCLGVIHDLNFEHFPENIIYSHRKYLLHYFPKFAKRATRIATVSAYSKQDIVNTYQLPPQKIDIVYNGANNIFKPIKRSRKEEIKKKYSGGVDYFIFIGTLHPRKNLEHLFLAFDLFKKQTKTDHKLLVVGNKKWWPKSLETIYQQLEHKEAIIFTGRLKDEQLNEVLASATALTYLPYFEGFGIPILEAFESETAVITANVTSMPEVAKDAAIFCHPRNINEIADAMITLISHPEKREQLINNGKKRRADFSWDQSARLLWDSMLKTLDS